MKIMLEILKELFLFMLAPFNAATDAILYLDKKYKNNDVYVFIKRPIVFVLLPLMSVLKQIADSISRPLDNLKKYRRVLDYSLLLDREKKVDIKIKVFRTVAVRDKSHRRDEIGHVLFYEDGGSVDTAYLLMHGSKTGQVFDVTDYKSYSVNDYLHKIEGELKENPFLKNIVLICCYPGNQDLTLDDDLAEKYNVSVITDSKNCIFCAVTYTYVRITNAAYEFSWIGDLFRIVNMFKKVVTRGH